MLTRRRNTGWIDQLARRTIVAHLTDGTSLTGVLEAAHWDSLVLVDAAALGGGGRTGIDGKVIIPREQLSWIQDLPAGDVAVNGPGS